METTTTSTDTKARTEKATFGAGCFWQVEATFQELPGVLETAVGYEGGYVDNPTYEQVCGGTTGHVEVCQVTFDPSKVSYEDLVAKYFEIHDPTQLNRQGPDVGYQYRSVIFAHSDEQAETARRVIERRQPRFRRPDRHRGGARQAVLARRGVSPVLPRQAPFRRADRHAARALSAQSVRAPPTGESVDIWQLP